MMMKVGYHKKGEEDLCFFFIALSSLRDDSVGFVVVSFLL